MARLTATQRTAAISLSCRRFLAVSFGIVAEGTLLRTFQFMFTPDRIALQIDSFLKIGSGIDRMINMIQRQNHGV